MQTEISFRADDGVTLPGVLTLPDDREGHGPALVMIYEAFARLEELGVPRDVRTYPVGGHSFLTGRRACSAR